MWQQSISHRTTIIQAPCMRRSAGQRCGIHHSDRVDKPKINTRILYSEGDSTEDAELTLFLSHTTASPYPPWHRHFALSGIARGWLSHAQFVCPRTTILFLHHAVCRPTYDIAYWRLTRLPAQGMYFA